MYDEIELREKTQEEINEIEKLRKKRDDEFIDLLIKLDTDKKYIQEELILIEIKLKNLKIKMYLCISPIIRYSEFKDQKLLDIFK